MGRRNWNKGRRVKIIKLWTDVWKNADKLCILVNIDWKEELKVKEVLEGRS